ncbi:transcriptional regulator, TetR family protein [Synechococcus sp. PCC 7335]|uniref:TetR/AcrR family transcriptional regulator n=1 Tax=Synechococcus sp. (strain ATCC 29403 / PCC 7335) TaxID=91464 RepID=UPI00017EBF95|nr:TetR/AcrR family transcriptional regulator [Synechococcus sp. PCC 7335]EDX84061.1 transcriptional regulator, TetR family protein [Synechococcus sp. PCC 7335]
MTSSAQSRNPLSVESNIESEPIDLSNGTSGHNPDKATVILSGALSVFSTQGYAASSMDRIAKAAKVSKPTLYKYFQDKEGLFFALVQKLTERNQQMRQRLLDATAVHYPPDQVLRQLAMFVTDDFSRDQALMNLMRLIIGESERFPTLAQRFVREVEKPIIENFARYLAAQTQLQLSDPMVTARIFVGSIVHYLLIQNVLHGSEILPLERDRMVNGLVQLITAMDTTSNS